MLCLSTSTPPLDNIFVYLALLIATCFVIFKIYRIYKFFSSRKKRLTEAEDKRQKQREQDQKNEAIAKFKEIHTKARDHREKIAKEITSNPKETTSALRKMMKR